MGARHSRAAQFDKTQRRGNLARVASPKQGSNKSNNSDTSGRSSTSQHWIHEGVDAQEVHDMHDVIAYGQLGLVRICSRRRQQHSTHRGECVLVGENNHVKSMSERTHNSSESSSHTASNRGSYHRLFACKTISTSRLRPNVQDELIEDVTRIRDLPKHANILTFHQVYVQKRHIQILTELCSGGDLNSRIHLVTEMDIVDILEQVSSAVAFLHEHGLRHSNLKLENVLYEHVGSNAGIKLVDFGVSRRYAKCRACRNVCGADYASAPEVYFNDNDINSSSMVSPASDVWSIGVLAYYMLSSGTYPFGTDLVVDEDCLQTASVSFPPEEWKERGISETAQTFCKHCFALDPNQRWTANEALAFIQEWMTTVETLANEQPAPELPPPTLDVSLRGTQGFDLFGQGRKRLLTLLADTMNVVELKKLENVFLDVDESKSGLLSMHQVKRAVKQYCNESDSCTLTKDDMKAMFQGCHQDQLGSIDYVPFLKAVVEMQGMMTHERIGDALDRADPEDKGVVSKEELKLILCQYGCDEHVMDTVMVESNCETDGGMVEYDVFLETLFQDPGKAMTLVHPPLSNDSV